MQSIHNWNLYKVEPEQTHAAVHVIENKTNPDIKFELKLNEVNGTTFGGNFNIERRNSLAEKMTYRPDDIVINTFSKCGTTWIEQVTLLLLTGGDKDKLFPASKNTYYPGVSSIGKIWVEGCIEQDETMGHHGLEFQRMTWEQFNEAPAPRLIKSHAPRKVFLNFEQVPRMVIITRNILDACVSSYYHAFNPYKSGWPFDAWAAAYLNGKISYGGWIDWHLEWYEEAKKNPDKILWLFYEDVKEQPNEMVKKLADFLNIPYDDELINKVVEFSMFDNMKEQAVTQSGGEVAHMRKGIVGDWKNHFTKELYDEYMEVYNERMKGSGLEYRMGTFEE